MIVLLLIEFLEKHQREHQIKTPPGSASRVKRRSIMLIITRCREARFRMGSDQQWQNFNVSKRNSRNDSNQKDVVKLFKEICHSDA
jgi:hypothetical protein